MSQRHQKTPAGRTPLTANPEELNVGDSGPGGKPARKAAAKPGATKAAPVAAELDWETLSTYAPKDLQTKLGVVCELLGIEKREGIRQALELFLAKHPPEKLLQQKLGGR
ncbi:hypothetical protein ACGF07_31915 [Kitasatospora sp. NPDC048194]|uniref:hypothetical protein n=1 Tax=Kitasatospora sp. NPDC048194 TaxID=3364045 RepID=UPI003719D44E